MNNRQTRTKKHGMVGGRQAVSWSGWFEEDTAVTNSRHLGPILLYVSIMSRLGSVSVGYNDVLTLLIDTLNSGYETGCN